MPSPQAQRPALLIVDMQVGLFHGPEQPFEGSACSTTSTS